MNSETLIIKKIFAISVAETNIQVSISLCAPNVTNRIIAEAAAEEEEEEEDKIFCLTKIEMRINSS